MRKSLKSEIGERIRDIRTSRGMSQVELSEKTGILRTTISRIETGNYNPSLDVVEKIFVALGVTISINE